MAVLKSYSCPKCGSSLEVDRDRDVFDCPFCGNHFTVLDFHRDDLLAEARKLVYDGQKSQALEKYEYLLKIKPNDFDLLFEYACAVDGAGALKRLSIATDELNNTHEKLRLLLRNDPRYIDGVWGEYFTKLYEVVILSNKYNELKAEQTRAAAEARRIKYEKDHRHHYWFLATAYGIIGFIFAGREANKLGHYYQNTDIRANWPFIVYFAILGVLVGFTVFANFKAERALVPIRQQRQKRYDKAHEKAENLLHNEVEPAKADYEKALAELGELRREVEKNKDKVEQAASPKASHPITLKTAVCSKCGGELTLDNENKLYVCNHCGVSYDYTLFVGAPSVKARKEIIKGEFDLAEKRYTRVLEEDPGDFEANRGMILCAGKWRALPDLRLNEKLDQVDWQKLEERVNAAKENSSSLNRAYFMAFEQLLLPVKAYYDAVTNPGEDSLEVIQTSEKSFKFRYHEFVRLDREYRVTYQKAADFEYTGKEAKQNLSTILSFGDFVEADKGYVRVLMYHPDDAEALRARILCAGRWKNIEEINLDQRTSGGLLDLIDARIKTAKEEAPEEYREFFAVFGDLAKELREFFELKNQGMTDSLAGEEVRTKFDEIKSQLMAADKELFPGSEQKG